MNRFILVRQVDGSEHHFSDKDLPLRLGSQADNHIVLPGTDPVTAYIGEARGHLFVQPVERAGSPLLHNDRRLSKSVWLKSKDQLRGDLVVVDYQRSGDRISFSVNEADQDFLSPELSPPLQPPQHSPVNETGAEIPVEVSRPKSSGRGKKAALGLIALGAVLLSCAVLFVLLARPLELDISPDPDSLSISGFPPAIRIGGRYLALPSTYLIKISKEGYKTYAEELAIEKVANNRLQVKLEKLPGYLNLDILPPDGVSVYSDDQLLGTTPPDRIEIAPGKHRLTLSKERYQPYRTEIFIEGAETVQDLKAALDPDWAEITVISEPVGAQVKIDGTVVGEAPITEQLLSGSHQIHLSRESYTSREQMIEVKAGSNGEFTYQLEPLPGQVSLTSRPDGAVVSIDNEYKGITPLTIALAAAQKQEIRLSHPGYKSLKQSIMLSPGEEKEIELQLEQEIGIVYLSTTPAGVAVTINGRPYSYTEGKLLLPAAPQKFEVSLSGYKSVSRTITPNPGFSQQLSIDLVPESNSVAALPDKVVQNEALATAMGHKLVLVKPKPFTMGAPRREPGRRANERERAVVMTRAFLIAEKLVTNGDYKKFDSSHNSGTFGGHSLAGDSQPVVNVTWNQAAEYLNWLSLQDNLQPFYIKRGDGFAAVSPPSNGYRLPTEAEWAFSARQAGNQQNLRYPWPGEFPPRSVLANFADESARTILPRVITGYDDSFPVTSPVGYFPANQVGLYDIGGNVSEWCHDYYSAYTAGLSTSPDPLGPPTGTHKVIRGSSWKDASVTETRLSYRAYHKEAKNSVGFRIVRYP